MLKRVRIKNYKSLDVDVELDPITVLIGKSGTGKTNFVEALRFLRDSVTTGYMSQQENALSMTAALPFEMSFDLQFDIAGREIPLDYALSFGAANRNSVQILEESLRSSVELIFHQRSGQVLKQATGMSSAGTILLGSPIIERAAQQARAFLSKGIGCYTFLDIRSGADERASGLADRGTNLGVVLDRIKDDLDSPIAYERVASALRFLNPTIRSWNTLGGGSAIQFIHAFNGDDLTMNLAAESNGLQKLLACLAALYQRPSKQVIVIEEPENGIHPGALAALAEEFKACPDEGRGQVIVTTHSPQFLDYFDIDNVRLVELENSVTRIRTLAREQVEAVKDGLLSPGELLTVDEARSGA